ncbi:protein downstream neighbor of son homolog [Copidosoma floridanum]|uniref:protein downstream neighbor of son homolog n=1 Tax=Copidosoma floridanum TaxID=29053 RepID=UPI0006C97500|nr:protein downstream neighbor of son homolog [Copidosoma floridanum]
MINAKMDWTKPDEVMKLFNFKLRKNALQARFTGTSIGESQSQSFNSSSEFSPTSHVMSLSQPVTRKRKNPFLKNDLEKKLKESSLDLDSTDSTFELLNFHTNSNLKIDKNKANELLDTCLKLKEAKVVAVMHTVPAYEEPKGKKYMPIDWTLKSKFKIMSPKPFAWNVKLKASEEASGTTGFVRRLDIGETGTNLDTSPNARFHQCCLVWQHPSIPWMELFPRSQSKMNVATSDVVALTQPMKDALFKDWCNSFRSLFHLVRVRQCPYFYACNNNFTVLFRAAGICGISEVQALLTPSTRGLREAINNEGIKFYMPLKAKPKKTTSSEINELNGVAEDDEENDKWLKSVGIEESEIRRITVSQVKNQLGRECDLDNMHESLIFVKGMEVQALFNFLINCKTIVTSCGPYSCVPPTLLSPVAFHGATLKPLKVKDSVVSNGTEKFYSLELTGPILPEVLPTLCSLMIKDQVEKFSVSCAQLNNTKAFTLAKHGIEIEEEEKLPQSVFGLENLTDCGFNKHILSHFCNPDPDRIQNFESLTCTDSLYTWS